MRKMLSEIDLEKSQGYPGDTLSPVRLDRELIVKPGLARNVLVP